jgi:cbb3-type cytochrome oxidase maturation protein
MSIILILIIASLSIALTFLFIFIWCVKSGQYDDTVAPALRILFDDPEHRNLADQTEDASIGQRIEASEADSHTVPSQDSSFIAADFNHHSKNFDRENEFHV